MASESMVKNQKLTQSQSKLAEEVSQLTKRRNSVHEALENSSIDNRIYVKDKIVESVTKSGVLPKKHRPKEVSSMCQESVQSQNVAR